MPPPIPVVLAAYDPAWPQMAADHGEFGIVGRRYCTLCDAAGNRIAHAHFFAADLSDGSNADMVFRDLCCAPIAAAARYEREKRRARELHPDDLAQIYR